MAGVLRDRDLDQILPAAIDLAGGGAHRADLACPQRHDLLAHVELAIAVDVVSDEEALSIGRIRLGEAFGHAEVARSVAVGVGVEIIHRRIERRIIRPEQRLVVPEVGDHPILHREDRGIAAAVEIDAVHSRGEGAVAIDVDPGPRPAVGAEEERVKDIDPRVDIAERDPGPGEARSIRQSRPPDVRRLHLGRGDIERRRRGKRRAVEDDPLDPRQRRDRIDRRGGEVGEEEALIASRRAAAPHRDLHTERAQLARSLSTGGVRKWMVTGALVAAGTIPREPSVAGRRKKANGRPPESSRPVPFEQRWPARRATPRPAQKASNSSWFDG